jgi:diguanylate cyclase (GGDEF)-like protein
VSILTWIEKRSRLFVVVFAVVLMVIIGIVDYSTGSDVDVDAFYLLPIVIAAWCKGRKAAWLVVLLSMCVSFVAETTFRADGRLKPFVYWNALLNLGYFLPVMYLTSALRERLIREEQSARTDSLTGAHNSRSFQEIMNLEMLRCKRNHEPLTVVFMDVDNFKQVNDRWGHERGDGLLCQVVAVMRVNLRPTDTLGRLGGDEFAVLMAMTDADQARAVLPRLRDTLLATMQEEAMPVTFSFGVASFAALPESLDDALKEADQLMYRAKEGGKNQIVYATFGETREHVEPSVPSA